MSLAFEITDIGQLARGTEWASADGQFDNLHFFICLQGCRLVDHSPVSVKHAPKLCLHLALVCGVAWGARSVLAIFTAWNSGAPQVASVLASDKSVRAARRAAAADHVAARAPHRGQRARPQRPQGSVWPGRYKASSVTIRRKRAIYYGPILRLPSDLPFSGGGYPDTPTFR
jgi:hypothetical protein